MVELVELIKYSGPSVLLIGVGLVWGKNLIEYFFKESIELKKFELNHDFEKFKSDIDQQNRNFQHSLDTRLNEFNIKYSKLHEERAEVIKELYVRLIELQTAMLDYTRRGQSVRDGEEIKDARLQRVNKALFDYNSFYIPRKIFFSSEITNKLNNLAQEYWDKGWDYSFIITQLKNGNYPADIHKEYYEKIKTINTTVQNDFSKLIEELENEFRKLLGVD